MIIDGRAIAQTIFDDLRKKTETLHEKGIIPHVAIILVGEDPASLAYVKQKEVKAASIGARATVLNYESGITNYELVETIKKLNNDPFIHGIIVQRPLPNHIDNQTVDQATDAKKDIDAFREDAPYDMPLAAAVVKILEKVYKETNETKETQETNTPFETSVLSVPFDPFTAWLKSKQVVVIGKGQTGGGPVITKLQKLGADPKVIDSKTKDADKLTGFADIIISTVGNKHAKLPQLLKKDVIMIIVGMYKGDDGKLHGDYEKEVLENTASFYTPVPGGVGPVNVAMLLSNLVKAAEKNPKISPLTV